MVLKIVDALQNTGYQVTKTDLVSPLAGISPTLQLVAVYAWGTVKAYADIGKRCQTDLQHNLLRMLEPFRAFLPSFSSSSG